ncbi:MAG: hypothetical protein PHC50_05305 [Candidatus Cloacimonetes bacterium]|nr:hypothetical protein [Candidatus Cloacimonadota bacterium]
MSKQTMRKPIVYDRLTADILPLFSFSDYGIISRIAANLFSFLSSQNTLSGQGVDKTGIILEDVT